ncbi:MAG TPA: hypothetical protein PK280_16660 [Planctomycetota bacterium]|nr:hypothetical protein [Planctomycetota bacterium]
MSFWDTHKNALYVAGLGVFVIVVGYFAAIRPWGQQADASRAKVAETSTKLEEYHPRLKRDGKATLMPSISMVQEDCRKRYDEYGQQLKDLKKRLRFPFEDFEYIQKLKVQERAGIYLSSTYVDVKFQLHKSAMDRNVPEMLERDWMGFEPPTRTDWVFKTAKDLPPGKPPAGSPQPVIAEEELRKLCLAEQVTQLALQAGISRVIKVAPLSKVEEAALHLQPNPIFRPGSKEPEKILVEYPNRFIVNYPVSAIMVGSPDAVMRFFHSVRQEKRFLVIRSFRIVSREDKELSGEMAARMRPGEVYVEISAACMDFREGEAKNAPVPVKPTGPIGPLGA